MEAIDTEADHFCDVTTVHGPKRVYKGKGIYRYFWLLAFSSCLGLLILQITLLTKDYLSKPMTTDIEIIMPEEGLQFPTITICNYNAIKNSYISEINATGEFTNLLLNYITLSILDVEFISSIRESSFLQNGNDSLTEYIYEHPDFSVKKFYTQAGLTCQDVLKVCTFGGREFDCCQHAVSVLTDMGMCLRIQLDESNYTWLHSQKIAGINNGLQLIADINTQEQITKESIFKNPIFNGQPIFANQLTMGLRFYTHIARDLPHTIGDGISVQPGGIIYSSLTPIGYTLLHKNSWGGCIEEYPDEYQLDGEYSTARCQAFCRAKYFNSKCGCSPFVYDLDEFFTLCTPLRLYQCIKNESIDSMDESLICPECSIECEKMTYDTSNSYTNQYSPGAYEWFNERNPNWTIDYIKNNFVALNIYYKELTYEHISQSQGTDLVVLFSNIGGNMGMFLGMSLLSCTEILIFFTKLIWIILSKSRRKYMNNKRVGDKKVVEQNGF